ncbi:hypothetical protein [Pontibacter litorisediminis]|uniref:hypothetical protein n=1 Tax=Pontibacter litorisediminis TaxID=1846260 RepID=UPI0023ED651C|nr:hypothetical protein [Pontibacter litorisediminis]
MKYKFLSLLCVLLAVVTLSSCHISRKKTDKNGKVVVISKSKTATRKDNGLHKGWYKNPNNPHHPNTTNPGHTKHKGNGKGNTTVVVVKGHNATATKGKPAAKGNQGSKGGGQKAKAGNSGKGGKGKN